MNGRSRCGADAVRAPRACVGQGQHAVASRLSFAAPLCFVDARVSARHPDRRPTRPVCRASCSAAPACEMRSARRP
ncbi:hypothetical protein VI03_04055 [Burkholderia vietnamiensis]|uniref:Uncharacterized protein n=1 Tax=Burkholderia ubonensis TaxID=101571 RepID=A0A1B4LIL0_9BURK|nr:hypothetical protein WJ35_18145 [Burkholderia ubonensis]AOK02551.1 hypothetical protein WK23_28145 [Burkholderia vietnamiensis]AOK14059.1 hypothetical protein WK31_27600 [Burkholderia vietnamiensis]AOK44992.1 hypothetical protein WL96_28275 [Burkholderia vietnamiensis]AVR14452.1 hypothetical protein A8H33_13265 [Burkholderia vietnamiensis]